MDMTFNLADNSKRVENLKTGNGYTAADTGSFNYLDGYIMENRDINLQIPSKLFLHKLLNLTGAEISINKMPSNTDFTGRHKHKENEEIIIVIAGTGAVLVNNTEIPVKQGSVVKIGTGKIRALKSIENLIYICIQVKENSLTNYTLTDAEML